MKSFMEEYGKIVVAAIIILLFVIVASPVGTALRDGVSKVAFTLTDHVKESFGGVEEEDTRNEYGFYFDRKYSTYIQDVGKTSMEFHEDGSVTGYMNDEFLNVLPAGTAIYSEGKIEVNGSIFMVSSNGKELVADGGVFIFILEDEQPDNEQDQTSKPSGIYYEDGTYKDWETLKTEGKVTDTAINEKAFRDEAEQSFSIVIPDTVTSIGRSAFNGSKLTDVYIPESVTNIGGYAFNSCTELLSVTIPDSVTVMDSLSFAAPNLAEITWRGTMYTDPAVFNQTVKNAGIATSSVWVQGGPL